MVLKIAILGLPIISRDGRPLDLTGYKPLALLTYLLLTEKPQSRSHLSGLLFPQTDDPRGALRWTLSQLRKQIGSDAIKADRQEITFNFAMDYWLDAAAFESGILDLYRGELLEEIYLRDAPAYNNWLLVERERLRALYQTGLEERLRTQLRDENPQAVEATAVKLLRIDNLREDRHRVLMHAYAQQGKYSAAQTQYEHCRRILQEEMDLHPALQTVELSAAIERDQVRHSLAAAQQSDLHPDRQRAITTPAGKSNTRLRILFYSGVLLLLLIPLLFTIFRSALQDGNNSTAFRPDLMGTTVIILAPIDEEERALFIDSLLPFEEQTGIDVQVGTFHDLHQVLPDLIGTGLAPDIVQIPQPGLVAEFARRDQVIDVRSFLDQAYLEQQYSPALLDAALIEGRMAGVWYKNNIKSLVWYPKSAFDEAGYKVPQTWDELITLTEQIAADGRTPWCISIQSGDSSGWVGTDWVEDILLRTAPAEDYDAWVAGQLPFNSPQIHHVFSLMEQIWLDDRYVYGGRETIKEEFFVENAQHLLDNPPSCFLHRQSSFIIDFLPQEAVYGQDYDFFYLPPTDPAYGRPVLGAGDMMAMFNDRPEVRELMRYFTTAESVRPYVERGGIIAPHRDAPFEWYTSPAQLKMAHILHDATTYRFDGSDMMPTLVGTGSFWQGIVDWVAGEELGKILMGIDASWPKEN